MTQAKASTERYKKGTPLSILDGIPVGVKDEIDIKGYPTRVGTVVYDNDIKKKDSTAVKRLRDAGCIIIGKTNMHEIGIGVTGHNVHFGTPLNPYNTSHYPGGSSSGSAVAVAAGLVPIAIGADGGGSIRIPSSFSGMVGIKPTFGRISEKGSYPLVFSVGHLGPITNNVVDNSIAYSFMAGKDPGDHTTLIQPAVHLNEFDNNDLSGITFGIFKEYFNDADEEVVKECTKMVERMKKLGAKIKEIEIPHLNEIRTAHAMIILSEMADATDKVFVSKGNQFGPLTRANLLLARSINALEFMSALKARDYIMKVFDGIFSDVDVIITPTTAMVAPEIEEIPTSDLASVGKIMKYAFLGNIAGIPAITLPVGYTKNSLPVGIQFMADHWREDILYRVARICEAQVNKKSPERIYSKGLLKK